VLPLRVDDEAGRSLPLVVLVAVRGWLVVVRLGVVEVRGVATVLLVEAVVEALV